MFKRYDELKKGDKFFLLIVSRVFQFCCAATNHILMWARYALVIQSAKLVRGHP